MKEMKLYGITGLIALLILLIVALCSCYTPIKASRQHGKAVSTFPAIGADYCARTYPCLPEGFSSDTVTVYDTLWGEPEVIINSDTVRVNDTVRIVRTAQLPSKIITRTVTIKDTIRVKDRAELDLCSIERRQVNDRADRWEKDAKKYQKQRNKLRWILAAIGAAGLLYLFLLFRRKTKK